MSLPKFEKDMAIIQKLNDEPNDVGGQTADELKASFDEGGEALKKYINDELTKAMDEHIEATDNPHSVTKEDVELGSVDNTSDADKPVSVPQQEALDLKTDKTNVLEKTNETVYTPTKDYHPATKKYADDILADVIIGQLPVNVFSGRVVIDDVTYRSYIQVLNGKPQMILEEATE